MSSFRLATVTLAVVGLVSACSSTQSWDPRSWFSRDDSQKPAVREVPGVEARLRGIGSAINGVVRVRESGELMIVFVELNGVTSLTYRVVFHENGNCSSPNGFSAGAPWSAPGSRAPATQLVPLIYANTNNGRGELVARIRGVRMGDGGMVNRGVLVYEGSTAERPKPDTPNNVVACGAFVKSTTLF